jgi:hypothetical protein
MSKVDRKAATAAYKDRKSQAGVYAVRCSTSGEVWVGESPNVDNRQTSLWFALRQQSYPRPDIVEAWKAHGEAAFSFEVVERIDPELSPLPRGTALKEAAALWREELKAKPL